jgi:hypothetical protein
MTETEQIYAALAEQRAASFHAGPLGLPEGAQAAVIPAQMAESWNSYWDNYRPNSVDPTGAGGALVRIGPDAAVYTFTGKPPIYLHRTSNLNALANLDPGIAAEWKKSFGFEPVAL